MKIQDAIGKWEHEYETFKTLNADNTKDQIIKEQTLNILESFIKDLKSIEPFR